MIRLLSLFISTVKLEMMAAAITMYRAGPKSVPGWKYVIAVTSVELIVYDDLTEGSIPKASIDNTENLMYPPIKRFEMSVEKYWGDGVRGHTLP